MKGGNPESKDVKLNSEAGHPQLKTALILLTGETMIKLALMCKSKNYRQSNRSHALHGEFCVGDWVIAEKRRKELLGSKVVLTESQKSPAYMGGTIVGFSPTVDGKCEVFFREEKDLQGNTDSISHPGWGVRRSVCYV